MLCAVIENCSSHGDSHLMKVSASLGQSWLILWKRAKGTLVLMTAITVIPFILLRNERAEETPSASLRNIVISTSKRIVPYFSLTFWKSESSLALKVKGKLIKYLSDARHSGTCSNEFQMILSVFCSLPRAILRVYSKTHR